MDGPNDDIIANFERRLKEVDRAVARNDGTHRRHAWTAGRVLRGAAIAVVAAVLPLVALVRLSSWFYLRLDWPTWGAMGGAIIATVVLVTVGAAWFSRRLTGKARIGTLAKWVAVPLVAAYAGYALLYVADTNTKTPEVRAFYRTLHPILRVSLSTLILADDQLVITDLARTPADYERMGLPVFERSHHLKQRNGYVHAADLRTIGRSEARNWLVLAYFKTMGFRTLRHVGTADHLHVGLDVR